MTVCTEMRVEMYVTVDISTLFGPLGQAQERLEEGKEGCGERETN